MKDRIDLANKCEELAKALHSGGCITKEARDDVLRAAEILREAKSGEAKKVNADSERAAAAADKSLDPCWRCKKRYACSILSAVRSCTNAWAAFNLAHELDVAMERCRISVDHIEYKLTCSKFENDGSMQQSTIPTTDFGFY